MGEARRMEAVARVERRSDGFVVGKGYDGGKQAMSFGGVH